jgi:hypothetical protein
MLNQKITDSGIPFRVTASGIWYKSTFARLLRSLVDPHEAPLRSLPGEDRDLFVSAANGHVLAFDNVSQISNEISDALCQIATGGAFAARKLYSDGEEAILHAANLIILNGIGSLVSRHDLADRAIVLDLSVIEERKTERDLWASFDKLKAGVFGALCDALSMGLRNLADTPVNPAFRLADFAQWASACEPAFAELGAFERAYAANREEIASQALGDDPVADAVRLLMQERGNWEGSATQLLEDLGQVAPQSTQGSNSWPKLARTLSERLRRAGPVLRSKGISVSFSRAGAGGTRVVTIRRLDHGQFVRPEDPTSVARPTQWRNSASVASH